MVYFWSVLLSTCIPKLLMKQLLAVTKNYSYFLSQLALCHGTKYSRKRNFPRGKVYFGSEFQRFQSMTAWPFGPVVRQHIMVGHSCSISRCPQNRKRGRERRNQNPNLSFKGVGMPLMTQLPSTISLQVTPPSNSATGQGPNLQHIGLWSLLMVQLLHFPCWNFIVIIIDFTSFPVAFNFSVCIILVCL